MGDTHYDVEFFTLFQTAGLFSYMFCLHLLINPYNICFRSVDFTYISRTVRSAIALHGRLM